MELWQQRDKHDQEGGGVYQKRGRVIFCVEACQEVAEEDKTAGKFEKVQYRACKQCMVFCSCKSGKKTNWRQKFFE